MRFAAAIIGLALIAAPSLAAGQGVTRPVPHDGGWQITTVPDGGGCFARIAGDQVDTIVAINNRG